MAIHGVTLQVSPYLRIECQFLIGEDGWEGICEKPPITIHADSFERAKSGMESALGKHIEQLLRQDQERSFGHAA